MFGSCNPVGVCHCNANAKTYTEYNALGLSRFENEEYTLCLALSDIYDFRTRIINYRSRFWT